MTLKDLQPQITDALVGFLEELHHDGIKTVCVFTPFKQKKPFFYQSKTLNLDLKLEKNQTLYWALDLSMQLNL